MIIREMFEDDINRKINGVIKVDQAEDDVIEQELNEYVITKELRKHFRTFFNNYSEAFNVPTADIGVWISGFFGSGKSHFLKMLSYILSNREVNGIKTVDRFQKKIDDDSGIFLDIKNSTKGETETILFNIDIQGPIEKDKTAVLRVFAKMFYNHLGFYGEDLKLAKLEQFVAKKNKTDEFRAAFEQKNGTSWLKARKSYVFFEDDVVEVLEEVLGMSEASARNWFNGTETTEMSIAQLVSEIKEYVGGKPKDFRLLFMIDEVGQYVGTDTDLLLNLQSLIEKIGSECGTKVWVVTTGQEAIDEIIKVRADEFSRIQARFKTRLSLSSSSVDEVIQKRILKKKAEATVELEKKYNQNDSVLRNLFSFSDSVLDIKGYTGSKEFAQDFPFVPYQFILMQKVFAEIRKHGNTGKHLSGGERSMLSGFQEAAQAIQEQDTNALVPFFRFYDTVHTFLDGSIRRVIERCEKAANDKNGIEVQDVDVLKLLYLVRYIDDIKATVDNIVILMADKIDVDKINLKKAIHESLNRLLSQNYIGRTGDCYNFLTDEEQDIQREIKNTNVDTSEIVNYIGNLIFGDIYTAKKYRYDGKYDFSFDQMVDNIKFGNATADMKLHFLTLAADQADKTQLHLMTASKGKEAIIVLADTQYYDALEKAMKIRKYAKQRNITQLAKSMQTIIREQQEEANKYFASATNLLTQAIEEADYYVDGEHLSVTGSDAKAKINQALEYLVAHIYSDLSLITKNIETDAELAAILQGKANEGVMPGMEDNVEAIHTVEEYLDIQELKHLPTSMFDIQSRYTKIPYGWREIDIAAVVAQLIFNQKVTVKYAGNTIQPSDSKLLDMLRKKSEIGKTNISKRQIVSESHIKDVQDFLRDYFDVMNVNDDEDGIVKFIISKFQEQKNYWTQIERYYNQYLYPDHLIVQTGIDLYDNVLSQKNDNIALIKRVIQLKEQLYNSKEALLNVDSFFHNQKDIYDKAASLVEDLKDDMEYISANKEAITALTMIKEIIKLPSTGAYNYTRIYELNPLIDTVKAQHSAMIQNRRKDLIELSQECMAEIHTRNTGDRALKTILDSADSVFTQKKQRIENASKLVVLDSIEHTLWTDKDNFIEKIEKKLTVVNEPARATELHEEPLYPNTESVSSVPKKNINYIYKNMIFYTKEFKNDAEIDEYLEAIEKKLKDALKDYDAVQLR